MPRFHFHIHDGADLLDADGSELPDLRAAQVEAVRLAGAVIRDDAPHLVPGEDWHMEVTDAAGLVLLRLDFSVSLSPAANGT